MGPKFGPEIGQLDSTTQNGTKEAKKCDSNEREYYQSALFQIVLFPKKYTDENNDRKGIDSKGDVRI